VARIGTEDMSTVAEHHLSVLHLPRRLLNG
jgi:hypothetical protein